MCDWRTKVDFIKHLLICVLYIYIYKWIPNKRAFATAGIVVVIVAKNPRKKIKLNTMFWIALYHWICISVLYRHRHTAWQSLLI